MRNKNFFKILLLGLFLGALAYQFRAVLFRQNPCEEPIAYVLGDFDSQFNISQQYFLNAIADAEAIWEKPFGGELFVYTPDAPENNDALKINLIYDYRQQATSTLASLGIVVKEDKASYDLLKAKLTVLQAEYERENAVFDTKLAIFYQKQTAYEKEVNFWNKKGGAPEEEYKKLETERRELAVLAGELQNRQNKINEMVDEINALVVALNRLADALNLSVDRYNAIGASRGESFEEGVYSSDGFSRAIDIYEFSSRSKLVRVLAHELGHALSLEHVDDSKAIMYEFNQGQSEALTNTDLNALKVKCGVL